MLDNFFKINLEVVKTDPLRPLWCQILCWWVNWQQLE